MKHIARLLLLISLGSSFSCGKKKSLEAAEGGGGIPGLTLTDGTLTVKQNSSASMSLGPLTAANVQLVTQPQHGKITIKGNTATYRTTNPIYNGTDTFTYKIVNNGVSSNEAKVDVTITPLASGTSTHTENYAGQNFTLNGWKHFSSATGHTASSLAEFRTGSFNGTATDARHFAIYGDNTVYAGDAKYQSLFGTLPIDGAGGAMFDWPWKADLIHIPECGVDATITMKLAPIGGQYPMVAILLNYDIDRNSATNTHEFTGYQVLANGGGGSLTLSRYNNANELALAFIDRWPNTNYGTENFTNPIESGPYKGWNYRNGIWPAGGNVGVPKSMIIAARYQYDVATGNTTISYEARRPDGSDHTPGVWDMVVTLTGADSLRTGGGFGIMPLNYHTSSMILNTDFDIAEYKLVCVQP